MSQARRRREGRSPERAPLVPVAVAVVGALLFALPLAGLMWRAPWSQGWQELSSQPARGSKGGGLKCGR